MGIDMTEDRITNLEIKLSFTEDLIDQLNQTIYKQQQQIEFLYRELNSIKEQSSNGDSAGNNSPKDEIPPHY
jgi:SlyX protein